MARVYAVANHYAEAVIPHLDRHRLAVESVRRARPRALRGHG